ncbi:hypothetical protein Tco_0203673, partial [Tanacetum coccineum]
IEKLILGIEKLILGIKKLILGIEDWMIDGILRGLKLGPNQKNLNHSKDFAHDNSLHSLVDIGRQTGLEVDNHSHDGHRSHKTHKNMARIGVVEGVLQNLENR